MAAPSDADAAMALAMPRPGDQGLSVESSFKQVFGPRHARAVKARFDVAVAAERPFFERLAYF